MSLLHQTPRTTMFIVKWLAIYLGVVAVIALLVGQLGLLRSRAPDTLGVRDGRLKPPSNHPNSVSSQAALYPDHKMRRHAEIAPLAVKGDGPATIERLTNIVERMKGARVVKRGPGYLYVQFTSQVMKFVDDTEFWFDPVTNVVHVRSAARVGRSDFGVNRRRVEAIRELLAAAR